MEEIEIFRLKLLVCITLGQYFNSMNYKFLLTVENHENEKEPSSAVVCRKLEYFKFQVL